MAGMPKSIETQEVREGARATARTPGAGEGDVNQSPRRQEWQARNVDAQGAALLERDAAAFLHQSVSTPCLAAIRKAEGV